MKKKQVNPDNKKDGKKEPNREAPLQYANVQEGVKEVGSLTHHLN